MMADETISFLVWCKYDPPSNPSRVLVIRVVHADTGEEVSLKDGSYLLRVSTGGKTRTTHCLVRHLESEREVHLQSGQRLPDFVRACLLREDEQPVELPGTSGEAASEQKAQSDDKGPSSELA